MIINRIYENQNLLSLQLVSFLVGLRTYQYPCSNSEQKRHPHVKTHTSVLHLRRGICGEVVGQRYK